MCIRDSYSTLRVVGNYGFNWLFSLVAGHKITDLGSGLNLYACLLYTSRCV